MPAAFGYAAKIIAREYEALRRHTNARAGGRLIAIKEKITQKMRPFGS
jgi:hypothetical protein